jgi:Amt family ammonium transporter
MDRQAEANKAVTETLINALRGDEFILFAQPIVALNGKPGSPAFQEILVRFQEEEQKMLPPGTFIPVLESCGLMHYLDRWVASRTVKWVRTFCKLRPGEPPPRNSINVAPDTLNDRGFAKYVETKFRDYQVPAFAFSFEISMNDAVERVEQVESLVSRLKPLGCAFAFAAFDGSRESFDLLARFQADFVKIGINLVGGCDRESQARQALEALHRRCRENGYQTIAEHVEREETLAVLREIGVDFAQGYHMGLPQPLE